MLGFLYEVFEERVLPNRNPVLLEGKLSKPPILPDLNPCDFLRGI
jgi:hypothetical protein